MRWAVHNGIITGSCGNLAPANNATRAETVTMLYRFATTFGAAGNVLATTEGVLSNVGAERTDVYVGRYIIRLTTPPKSVTIELLQPRAIDWIDEIVQLRALTVVSSNLDTGQNQVTGIIRNPNDLLYMPILHIPFSKPKP